MDIEEVLLAEHSKQQALSIANYVGCDENRFGELMELFLDSRIMVHQRAAMAVEICADKWPFLLNPYLGAMLKNLRKPVHDAVIRATIRAFQNMEMPEEIYGEAWDICFQYLVSPKYPVAIRVYSMSVLENICQKLPELKRELRMVIEEQMPYGSAGFVSRGNKILAKLMKH